MRILIVTQYFYPENFKSNDMAFELKKRGYDVDVLVGIPNYPEGKYYNGYGLFQKRYEKINGVRVFRAFQFPRGKNSGIQLALNYLSFAFVASVWAFFLAIFNKYHCVIVHEPSPITQGFPAVVVKKMQKIPLYFWVLDIWPDAMKSGGGINNKSILSFVDRIVKFMYTNSDKILISSKEFKQNISAKGNYSHKIEYFPNWSDDILKMNDNYPIPEIPQGFVIMLAGNIGNSQNMDAVMDAALELKNYKTLKWVLIGDGSKKEWVDKFIKEKQLEESVFTYGRFPFEAMPAFYKVADAMLLTLKGDFPHLKLVVPARLQSYMSASRPVLGMIDGAGAKIISESKCGYAVGGGDSKALVKIIKENVLPKRKDFESYGLNGRNYFKLHFQKDNCISDLCRIIKNGKKIS
jgi:glycosyltransferase involved in cell wall biosynthesis